MGKYRKIRICKSKKNCNVNICPGAHHQLLHNYDKDQPNDSYETANMLKVVNDAVHENFGKDIVFLRIVSI